jgi:hypothetical protein
LQCVPVSMKYVFISLSFVNRHMHLLQASKHLGYLLS